MSTAMPNGSLEEALAENRRLRTELESLRCDQASFWRAVSHELRTPLQAAMGFVDLFDPGLPLEKVTLYLSVIRRDLDRLTWVVDELHQQAELDGGTLQFNPAVIRLEPLLEAAARECEDRAPRHLVNLEWPPDLPCALADPHRTRQVVDKLLRNAVRLSVKGYPDISTIYLDARPAGDFVDITVRDDGPGLPVEYREAVFERFVPHRGRARWSVGLGLYTARQIARRLNGDLTVTGRPEKGSTFVFKLPCTNSEK